jgi:hypothetical protein
VLVNPSSGYTDNFKKEDVLMAGLDLPQKIVVWLDFQTFEHFLKHTTQ